MKCSKRTKPEEKVDDEKLSPEMFHRIFHGMVNLKEDLEAGKLHSIEDVFTEDPDER